MFQSKDAFNQYKPDSGTSAENPVGQGSGSQAGDYTRAGGLHTDCPACTTMDFYDPESPTT